MTGTAKVGCRRGFTCLTLILLIGLGGCNACRKSPVRAPDDIAYDVMLASISTPAPSGHGGSALIFDASPGPYHAEEFTYRSDWPSTVSYYSRGQATFYRERNYDYRGQYFGRSNPTYRRVDSVTYGAQYRP